MALCGFWRSLRLPLYCSYDTATFSTITSKLAPRQSVGLVFVFCFLYDGGVRGRERWTACQTTLAGSAQGRGGGSGVRGVRGDSLR